MDQWKTEGVLIRIKIIRPRGVSISIAARILAIDYASSTLTLYDVDRKVVELAAFNEIDDITAIRLPS
ncbi:hypothetical protein [Paenibacillus sp. GXUN7292]|uniref:hypothetical protein n=1 Tax=Paenibacillus sp. GXUN7292 TaxID=3422499 RepID=UPI003D7DE1C2